MILALALAAALQAAPADTAGAYLDPGARELVELARARREQTEGRIVGYETVATSRFTVKLRALHRERILWRCESAVRIHWQRDAVTRVEVLGKREVSPIADARPRVGEDPDCEGSSVFDPASDRLSITGMMQLRPDSGDVFLVHPLARGSEADYRFRSGGTTTISLPGGKTIRLRELVVIPRRSDSHLFTGSLWLDDDSHGVVRAVLRLARPIDLVEEARNEGEGDDDIPGFLQPMTADLRYVTLEYALWDGKYWLPRLVAFEGEAQVGRFANVPIRMEESYGAYEVEALPPGAPLPPRDTFAMPDSADACRRHVTIAVTVGEKPDSVSALDSVGCECHDGRCFRMQVVANRTPEQLLHSEFLPPSIYDESGEIVSPVEMGRLMEAVKAIAPPPWQLGRPTLRWGSQAADLLRYNRVEGLSVGARAGMNLGRLTADATVRLGLPSLDPSAEIGASRTRVTRQQRLAVYDRLNDASIGATGLGLGNSLSALLLGRDGGDYYRSYGAELTGAPAVGDGLSWRLFAELQRPVERETNFNLPNLFGSHNFRENLHADRADQVGASLAWHANRGLNPAGWRGSVDASVEASTGTFQFARPRLALTGAAPLPGPFIGSLQVAGGTSFGTLPAQSLWYLGGPATVRGYTANLLSGSAYWRARAAVAPSFPGARIVLFSDAGWAGDRGDVRFDPPLLSAGVGLSFLDGLIRFDLSRALRAPTGWRLDLHVDAPL